MAIRWKSSGRWGVFILVMLLFLSARSLAGGLAFNKADKALKAKQWAKAEVEYERVMAPYLARCGLQRVANFGPVYFKIGWCELKQEKWQEAALSFENCYKKFPSTNNFPNRYHQSSLRYWADAEYRRGNYKISAKLYQQYLMESKK